MVLFVRQAQVFLRIQGANSHVFHQCPHLASSDRDVVCFVEFRFDASVSIEGMRRVDFINEIHGFPVFFGNTFGLVVEA